MNGRHQGSAFQSGVLSESNRAEVPENQDWERLPYECFIIHVLELVSTMLMVREIQKHKIKKKVSEWRRLSVLHWNQPLLWWRGETAAAEQAQPKLHNADILRDVLCLQTGCQGVPHSQAIRKEIICFGCGRGSDEPTVTWAETSSPFTF